MANEIFSGSQTSPDRGLLPLLDKKPKPWIGEPLTVTRQLRRQAIRRLENQQRALLKKQARAK